MIRSFRDNRTAAIFAGHRIKGVAPELAARARRKLLTIEAAAAVNDLRVPPGNRLEKLGADRAGQLSIRVNDQWRLCFEWRGSDAFEVEFCDYH